MDANMDGGDDEQFNDNINGEINRNLGEKSNSEESRNTHMTRMSSLSRMESMAHLLPESLNTQCHEAYEQCNSYRKKCGEIVNHPHFQTGIIALIIVNAIMMGVATFDFVEENPAISQAFEITDLVFLVTFTAELVLQFAYNGYKLFMDGWLFFDFVIVVLSWSLASFQIIRAFRIFRALRLITRVKTMKNLITALFDIIPRLGAVTALLSLIFYIYAVLCTNLFGELDLSGSYFTRLDHSLMTLFEMMTMSWGRVARECMDQIWWAWLPFVTFIMITGFMVFNLIIAIVCDAVSALENKDNIRPDIKTIMSGDQNENEAKGTVQNPPTDNNEEAIIGDLEKRAENLSKSQKDTQQLLKLLSAEITSLQKQCKKLQEDR